MGYFSMPKYFQDMPVVGKPLVNANAENEAELKEIEKNIHEKRSLPRVSPQRKN